MMIILISLVSLARVSSDQGILHFYIPGEKLAATACFLGIEAVPHTDRES
jgi:hypothetical protein